MRRYLRATSVALCWIFLLTPARAEGDGTSARTPIVEASDPPGGAGQEQPTVVSLADVVRLAREKAPDIAAARSKVLQAEGFRAAAALLPDPGLALSGGRGKPAEGGPHGAESSLGVEQFFPSPWALRSRRRSGTEAIRAAQTDVEAVKADVVLEARHLYYEAAVGEAQALALDEAARDAAALRDLVARRVEVGEAPEADRLRTRVETLRTELEARAARAEAEGNRAALDRFLLGSLGADFAVSLEELDPRRLPAPSQDAVEVVLSRNPAYRAALSRVEAARWTHSAERASRLPGASLSLFKEKELDKDATGVALGFSLPLWNRNRGPIAISRGQLAEAEAEALALRTRLAGEAERLVRRQRVSKELAVAYHEEILPAAREALTIARFGLEQGETSFLAWLEARRTFLEVLRASYGVQLEAFRIRAELERLMGETDAADAP